MTAPIESRRLQRQGWPEEAHLAALDGDVDEIVAGMQGIREELRSRDRIMIGLLVTIAGGAVVGALNLVLRSLG